MWIEICTVLLVLFAVFLGWRFPKSRHEFWIAALLTLPILFLPVLAGISLSSRFLWYAVFAVTFGGLADVGYYQILRRHLTPVLHPRRSRLKWLLVAPLLAVILFWVAHLSLLTSSVIALVVALIASLVLGGTLIIDTAVSAVGFGFLYLILYLILNLPVAGSVPIIHSFSGIIILSHPLEELLLIFFFGSLWGPLVAAFRGPGHVEAAYRAKHHHLVKSVIISVFVVAFATGGYWVYNRFVHIPIVLAASPAAGTELNNLTDPITITFDRPVNQQNVEVTLTPKTDGDLSFGDPYLIGRTFVRQLTFTPSEHLAPGTTYTVHVKHISNLLGHADGGYNLTFHTPALPTVASASVADAATGVIICDPIKVTLDQSVDKLATFSFQLTPNVPVSSELQSDKKTYIVKPQSCLAQSTAYSLDVQRQLTIYDGNGQLLNSDDPVSVKTISFTTKGAPGIAGFTPQGGGVLATTKQLKLSFSEAMAVSDPSSYLTIAPALAGSWAWQDDHTLIYTVQSALPLDTGYTVTVHQGMKDAQSGFLPQDSAFSFTTIGHVAVSAISPRSGSGGVKNGTPVRVTFDQPVDQISAEQHFSLSPATTGTFSWQGQTMLYSAPISDNTTYTATESAGVASLIGLPSVNTATSSFQTEISSVVLNIAQYYQTHALSCEAASLHMALTYKGFNISENTLLDEIGADSTPRQGSIWADPNQLFVGDVNGHQDTTGYGVHADPIASVANRYVSAQALHGMTTTEVADDINQGNPVIFWGTAGNATPDSWTTPGGATINTWLGEHVRLIIGFSGPASNPISFTINDPIFGRLHWTASQLRGNWSAFGGMGVAIL